VIEILVWRRGKEDKKAKKWAPWSWEKSEGQTCRRGWTRERRWELRPDRNFNNAP
jgi:hypothetical protein